MIEKIKDENLVDVCGGVDPPSGALIQKCPACTKIMTMSQGLYYCSSCNKYYKKTSWGTLVEENPNTSTNVM